MSTVDPGAGRVKRRYNAEQRTLAAGRTRARVMQAARTRFLEEGYSATTIAAIAGDAGVSVDTVYKAFGGKPGLLRAIYDDALRGQQERAASDRSDEVQASERDPRRIVEAWGRFVAELSPRASPIGLLVRDAAAADPELEDLRQEIDAERLERMTANARRLAAAGHLRPGVSVEHAANVMWTYTAPEVYELLVIRRGMDADAFGRFVAEAMTAALL